MSSSQSLIKKTLRLSFAIFICKPIGLIRDILKIRYMGVGLIADAFSTAWRIPNSFRRIFGEGALSSVLVPTLVKVRKERGDDAVSELTTLILILFQIGIFSMCALIAYYAYPILMFIAPGAIERALYAVPLLQILIFFILAMSSSVILGSALQVHHIFITGPLSQFVLTTLLCIQFIICNHFKLSLVTLSWMILFNGSIIFAIFFYSYYKYGFRLKMPSANSWKESGSFFRKFLPALLGGGMVEINLFIDQAIASYLPVGSQSMFDYISSFIRIPLQVFGSSFATVSAPYFAEVVQKSPHRISYHIFESLKMIWWTTIPAILCVIVFAHKVLYTLLLSEKFTIAHVDQGALLMRVFAGYIFFSVANRILVNAYYALHETFIPTVLSIITMCINTALTYICMKWWGLPGIIGSTVVIEALRTFLLLYFLQSKMKVVFLWKKWISFCKKSLLQLTTIIIAGLFLYSLMWLLMNRSFSSLHYYAFDTVFYWLWTGPIVGLMSMLLYKSRRLFGIKLYYFDQRK